MKDKITPAKQDDSWRKKFSASQDELRIKEKQWQDTEKLLRLLLSRLSLLVISPDPVLTNNLKVLRKALREGENILQLNKLIKDISDRILQLENTELKSTKNDLPDLSSEVADRQEQLNLIHDVFIVLLENINFPSSFARQINKIKSATQATEPANRGQQLLASITALAEVLDDIFYNIKHDKQKIGLFLQQINSDLQNLDKGIMVSNTLQSKKQDAEQAINKRVESEMQEMEHVITTHIDIEQVKQSVQSSLNVIRNHMEKFKQQAIQHNQQSTQMMERLREQLNSTEQQCKELKKQILEKHQQTLSDPLTGIRNRLAYEEAIHLEIERFKRYGRPFVLLMLDLDNFKHVNDSYGHSVGDKVLQAVARILTNSIRSVDFLARYGGEEFVLILPELGLNDAKMAAVKICKAVQANILKVDGHTIRVTISGGISLVRKDDTAESLFERADTALYLAKERGRNRCETE